MHRMNPNKAVDVPAASLKRKHEKDLGDGKDGFKPIRLGEVYRVL